jgi:division protein CdvB (Snf7/Vps24/ESCRT-III family)
MSHPVIEPRGYVRGGFGEEMDLACLSITSHFTALPGWNESRVDPHEVDYLAGFFAFIALVSSPSAPLGLAEAATGARATVARRLMLRGTRAESLNDRLKWFKARLGKYSALWVGVLKDTNTFGAFGTLAFENVQAGDRTRQGYVEHLNAFPDFCERTIRAFHEAGQRSDRSVAAMPIDFSGIKEQAEEAESRLREALRTLAEVGNPEALRASAGNRARHADALAQVRAAKDQLERLSALLDSLESIDASTNK